MKAKAIVLLLLTAIVLSGCAGKKDDGGDSASSTSTSSSKSISTTKSGSASTTGTGTSAPGTITVNLTRSTPNGAVPLAVNFTIGAKFSKAGQGATPADAAWSVRVLSGNATNRTSTAGPTGKAFPSNFTLNFTAAGNHTVVVNVTASGYAPSNATILVTATAGGPGTPIFFDGAEADASQFTITSNVFLTNIAPAPSQELAAPQTSKWAQAAKTPHSGTKVWASAYLDNYRTRLTTVAIKVPAGGATLSYWAKGGAEGNGIDGLFVLVNGVQVSFHNSVPDWTMFSFPVPAGDAKIEFRFDSDSGCSAQTPGPAGDPSGMVCGEGYDQGGLLLDDITVA